MVVLTHDRKAGYHGAVGLHVELPDVEEHFPRHVSHIELELDHLLISCSLDASFWEGKPVIHDGRLSSWLEAKRMSGKLAAKAAPVALIPSGSGSYRVQLIVAEALPEALPVPKKVAYVPRIQSPLVLVDRRKFDTVPQKDRRKTGGVKPAVQMAEQLAGQG